MKYDYKCTSHGVFEADHSIKDATGVWPCPQCNYSSPRHHGDACDVVFHGQGWTKRIQKIDSTYLNNKNYVSQERFTPSK